MIGRSDQFVHHLTVCEYVSPAVCQHAEIEKGGTPKHTCTQSHIDWQQLPPPPSLTLGNLTHAVPSHSSDPGSLPGIFSSTPQVAPGHSSSPMLFPHFPSQSPMSSNFSSAAPSPALSSISGFSGAPRASPALSDPHFPNKRLRGLKRTISHQRTSDQLPEWNSERQQRFDERIARLTASAGFPLSWVENPEWIRLCEEFIPATKSPSCKVLTKRILPNTLKAFRASAKKNVSGHNATAQCDGWTGKNTHHFIAFMMAANNEVSMMCTFFSVS